MDISGKNENPVCNDKDYRKKVCSSLKNLKRIDGVPLKEEVPEYDKKDDKGLNLDNMELDDGTEWYGDISKLQSKFKNLKKRESKLEIYDKKVKDTKKSCKDRALRIEDSLSNIEELLK